MIDVRNGADLLQLQGCKIKRNKEITSLIVSSGRILPISKSEL